MHNKSFFIIGGVVAMVWLGYMAWLSGYQQGYDQGSQTAWSNARSALAEPLPTLNIETVSSKTP